MGDKWINSVVHFALWVVPVYEITILADVVVLNTIEFWTGSNPVSNAGLDVRERGDGGLRVVVDGKRTYELVPLSEERVGVILDGRSVGVVQAQADGTWGLWDEHGRRSTELSVDDIARARQMVEVQLARAGQ